MCDVACRQHAPVRRVPQQRRERLFVDPARRVLCGCVRVGMRQGRVVLDRAVAREVGEGEVAELAEEEVRRCDYR